MFIFCVKCKDHTDTTGMFLATTKNDRKMVKGICVVCDSKKCRFVKKGFELDEPDITEDLDNIITDFDDDDF